jgi:1-acyl-sn-glycerol-3-phosphate acyltransferase
MTAVQAAPGPWRYHVVRLGLKVATSAYVRTTVSGAEHIPASGPYIICFNHPSWLDPIFLAAYWPDPRRRLYIFGPRERDMAIGIRNHLISWTRRAVPFMPQAADVVDVTRRAVAVLRTGACLAIAGEGRLSDHEGEILPLETGLAHFSRLAGAPILPVAVVGTRWIAFGSRVALRIGAPVSADDFGGGRQGALAMTTVVEARLREMLAGVVDRDPPGWLGRTISEAFNDRPWLDQPAVRHEAGADDRPLGRHDAPRDGQGRSDVPGPPGP